MIMNESSSSTMILVHEVMAPATASPISSTAAPSPSSTLTSEAYSVQLPQQQTLSHHHSTQFSNSTSINDNSIATGMTDEDHQQQTTYPEQHPTSSSPLRAPPSPIPMPLLHDDDHPIDDSSNADDVLADSNELSQGGDGADDLDELPCSRFRAAARKKRRLGFSVFIDPNDHPDNHVLRHLTLCAASVPVRDKTRRLQQLLSTHPLFRTLSPEITRRVYTEFIQEVKSGDNILFSAGDMSDVFYLIDEGEITCTYTEHGHETNLRKTTGETIGDLALMQPSTAPQTFTARVSTPTTSLYSIDGNIFRFLIQNGMQIRYGQLKTFFQGLSFFEGNPFYSPSCQAEIIENLIENAQILEFNQGEVIIPIPPAASTSPPAVMDSDFSSFVLQQSSSDEPMLSVSPDILTSPSPFPSAFPYSHSDDSSMPLLSTTTSSSQILPAPPASSSSSSTFATNPFANGLVHYSRPSSRCSLGTPTPTMTYRTISSSSSFNEGGPSSPTTTSNNTSTTTTFLSQSVPGENTYLSNAVFIVKDGQVRRHRTCKCPLASPTSTSSTTTIDSSSMVLVDSATHTPSHATSASSSSNITLDEGQVIGNSELFGLEILSCPHRLLEFHHRRTDSSQSPMIAPVTLPNSYAGSGAVTTSCSSPSSRSRSLRKRIRSSDSDSEDDDPTSSGSFTARSTGGGVGVYSGGSGSPLPTLIRSGSSTPYMTYPSIGLGHHYPPPLPSLHSSMTPLKKTTSHTDVTQLLIKEAAKPLAPVDLCACRGEVRCESTAAIIIAIDAKAWKSILLKSI